MGQKGSPCSPERGSEPKADSSSRSKLRKPTKTPYWNDDPCAHWLGPANLAYVHFDSICTWVLLDDGSQINSITPAYAKSQGFAVGPLEELASDAMGQAFQGIRGIRTGAIGYIVFRVRIEGIPSYDEEQVALVIEDSSSFSKKVPVLGMLTLHRVIRSMKESEMEQLPMAWQQIKTAYEITNNIPVFKTSVDPDAMFPTNTGADPIDIDEVITLTEKFTLPAFASMIIKGQTKNSMMMGRKLHVMTQAPYYEDHANLPNGLYVCRSYTKLKDGSRKVGLVVRNGTSRPISMKGGRIIGRVVTANIAPKAKPSPELWQELNKDEEEPTKKLTVEERQELLMQVLQEKGGLDMLKNWEKLYADQARQLLMEFHNVFSLEKNEMGCTDTTEHVTKLTKSEPFKEKFWRIAPPLMDEVHQHLQEMLDGGAIQPSTSPLV